MRDVAEPLLIREHQGRVVMGRAHRMFHRRQAQATTNVLTVSVQVVNTLDTAGNVIGQATLTPGLDTTPATVAPSIVTAADLVPSVPAVPPFPTDLNVPSVPSYPWPSGVPTAVVTDASTSPPATSAPLESTTSAPLESTTSAAPTSVNTFPSLSGYNSTTSITTSSSVFSSLNATSSHSSSSSPITSSPTTSSPTSSAKSSSLSFVGSSTAVGGGFVDPANTAATQPTATTAPVTDAGSNGPLETPQVVGTVVGSLAGVAILLFIILFVIKRHKQTQRGGALQLTGDDRTDASQPTTYNPARTSFVPPSFLNRFSGASRSTAESSGTGERSFQRISGRKLPSAFSEGMTSEQFAAGRGEGTLSGSSFYHDDKGFYGGPGVFSKDFGDKSAFDKETGETSNVGTMGTEARVRPSPAQTPVIRHADDTPVWGTPHNGGDTLSPPMTPNPDFPPRGSLGRSHPSRDGSTISRNSRFTENV